MIDQVIANEEQTSSGLIDQQMTKSKEDQLQERLNNINRSKQLVQ